MFGCFLTRVMQDPMGYIGIETFSVVVLLLYRLVPRSCVLSLFRGRPGPRLAGVKGLLLRSGSERRTNAELTFTSKVIMDNSFCVTFVVATNHSILDSVAR